MTTKGITANTQAAAAAPTAVHLTPNEITKNLCARLFPSEHHRLVVGGPEGHALQDAAGMLARDLTRLHHPLTGHHDTRYTQRRSLLFLDGGTIDDHRGIEEHEVCDEPGRNALSVLEPQLMRR
jgi:hypothetical protein